jgi:hypothetical protein
MWALFVIASSVYLERVMFSGVSYLLLRNDVTPQLLSISLGTLSHYVAIFALSICFYICGIL